jgi:glycosyltransferase involved in cell wall biosynthesis
MGATGLNTVSVAIPVYNGEKYLAEALASVQAQTVQPTERLVFDNCSTDGTREIAAASFGPDAVRTTERNVGAVANFNRAVHESTGTFFAWLAADDRLSPTFVERARAALEAHPEAPACLPAIQFIDPAGAPGGLQTDLALGSADPVERLRSFLRRPRWTESYCLYRREALLGSPMFRDAWGADVLLTWWFLLRGPLLVLDEPLYEYRLYPVKSAVETAEGLNPHAAVQQWRMTRLWLELRRSTYDAGVDRRVARAARRELRTALFTRHWLKHVVWDGWLQAQALPGLGWTRHLKPPRRSA